MLFSDDPDDYLDKASALDRISVHQAEELKDLQTAMRELAQERSEATRKLGELDKSRKAVASHKRTVEKKLARARQLLGSLPSDERAAYDRVSRSGRSARADLPDLGSAAPASSRAEAALAAARSALGKPYVWGANGPSGFDCSGLMQWSYAQAASPCRAPRRPSVSRAVRSRCPRPSPVTWSPTATTPAMSRCTWATVR